MSISVIWTSEVQMWKKSGIYDFLSQFGHAESKNGGYQK